MYFKSIIKETSVAFLKRSALLVFSLYVLWHIVSRTISSNRGFDLEDEGLYLLTASNSDLKKSLGSPWGWHTKPFYSLVNENISNFRTLGGVILVVLVVILGHQLSIRQCTDCAFSNGFCKSKLMKYTFVVSSTLSASFFYSGMLRTPSYNWVAVIGLLTVSIGFVKILKFDYVNNYNNKSAVVWMSFGIFFIIPGRPATALALLCLIFILFAFSFGTFKSLKLITLVVASSLSLIGTAVLLGFWDSNPLEVFGRAFRMPAFYEEQTPKGAIIFFLKIPDIFLNTLLNNNIVTKALLWISILIAVVATIFAKYFEKLLLVSISVWTLGCLSASNIHSFMLPIHNLVSSSPQSYLGWASASITESSLLFLIGISLFFNRFKSIEVAKLSRLSPSTDSKLQRPRFTSSRNSEEFEIRSNLIFTSLVTFLFVAPFTVGLGAAAGPFRMAGLVSGFFILVSVCLVQKLHSQITKLTRNFLLITILAFVTISASWSLTSGNNNPWGTSFTGSVTSMKIGGSKGKLYIPENTAQVLTTLERSAIQNGWYKNTPIIDISWPWSPGIIFALEGAVPSSIIFGTTSDPFSEEAFLHNLKLKSNREFIENAWILLSTSDAIPESSRNQHSNILKNTELVLNKQINRDFESVATINGLILLKPRS